MPMMDQTNPVFDFIHAPDGTRLRTGFWPALGECGGEVFLIGGHREFMEKYAEFIGELQQHGLNVHSLDHRGQGLSDRSLEDPVKSHCEDFANFVSDLDFFIGTRKKETGLPLYLVAHSMGAHIALRYLHDHPAIFDKAVLFAPLTGINLGNAFVATLAPCVVELAVGLGWGRSFAWGQGAKRGVEQRQMDMPFLTHDARRYETESQLLEERPELFVGGATYGWVQAALKSLNMVRKKSYLEKIKTPLLILLAEEERVVINATTFEMFETHPTAKIVMVKGARHEIYRETDDIREKMWEEVGAFLEI